MTPEVQAAVERVREHCPGMPLSLEPLDCADLTTILDALSEANERASILQTALHERTTERDEARKALASPPPPKGEALPEDVVRLVKAAREVAFGPNPAAAIGALDKASEAFASRVPWEDEPADVLSRGEG